jgi:2-oxoglutarate/2-oxoacid ferredoxin oxidoreductase subunit beta
MNEPDVIVGIGGAAGDGVASAGNTLALSVARQGQAVYVEGMLNPLALALASGCEYVARGFSGQPKHLQKLCADGIQYPGFALIDVFSPCVTFNKHNTYDWFRKRVYRLEETEHDPTDFHAAMDATLTWGEKIPIGLFYRNPNPRPSLHTQDPGLQAGSLLHQLGGVSPQQRRKLIEEFM